MHYGHIIWSSGWRHAVYGVYSFEALQRGPGIGHMEMFDEEENDRNEEEMKTANKNHSD